MSLAQAAAAKAKPSVVNTRWENLLHPLSLDSQAAIRDDEAVDTYLGNVENYFGTVRVPLGLVGPLCVEGTRANGFYQIPMATTEAALVASYARGCKALTAAGGCKTALVGEGSARAPWFEFRSIREAVQFVAWLPEAMSAMKQEVEAESKSGNLHLDDVHPIVTGRKVILVLGLTTGNAAGQNMATFAADAIGKVVETLSPVKPQGFGNDAKGADGDKTSTSHFYSSFHLRGRRVVAESLLSREILSRVFRTTPEAMINIHSSMQMGRRLGGDVHDNVMCSNGVAAMFIALGQDAACILESSGGLLRLDLDEHTKGLYASLLMPNLCIGTVGGGTHLPGQSACLELVFRGQNHREPGRAGELAEVIGAACLGGELSVLAAMATGDFSKAHRELRERSARL